MTGLGVHAVRIGSAMKAQASLEDLETGSRALDSAGPHQWLFAEIPGPGGPGL